jgi:DNA-binding Lrp family transcriptional regulator
MEGAGVVRPKSTTGLISHVETLATVDAKDVRIFCELAFRELQVGGGSDSAPSPREIGRALGLDEKTVRGRVKKMEDSGFIKYYQATPSLALLGLSNLGLFRFEAMNIITKHRVLEYLRDLPRVVEAFDYLGPVVSVSIAGSGDEIKQTAAKIAGRFELTNIGLGQRGLREPQARLDGLDWQIIRRLRYDARCKATEMAEALSITRRMAEYRMSKVENSGAVMTRAIIDPRRQEGLVFYELEVSMEPSMHAAVERELKDMSGEMLWSISSPRPGSLLANLFGFSLGEPEESVVKALGIRGVRSCSTFVLKEVVEPARPNWIDAQIDKMTLDGGIRG